MFEEYNIATICFACCARRENQTHNLDYMTTSNLYEFCSVLANHPIGITKFGINGLVHYDSSVTLGERTGVIPSIEVVEWANFANTIPRRVIIGFHKYGENPAEDLELKRVGGVKCKFSEILLTKPEDIGVIEVIIPTLVKSSQGETYVNTRYRIAFGLNYAKMDDKGKPEFNFFRTRSIEQRANFDNDCK